MILLFGYSSFSIALGTSLTSFLVLPFVYLWAKELGGRKAGIVALLFVLLGPVNFFSYMCLPRGGYAVTAGLSIFILWLTGKLVLSELDNRKSVYLLYLILGFVAGIAWWTNQLITATIISAGLYLTVILKLKIFSIRPIIGAFGFITGSAPFWLWNVRNEWESFSFLNSFSGVTSLKAFSLLVSNRLPMLFGVYQLPFSERTNFILVYSALILCALIIVAAVIYTLPRRTRKTDNGQPIMDIRFLLLFFVVSTVIYCFSSFAGFRTPRYLVLLVPAFAILLGYVTARLSERTRFVAWLPLILLLTLQPHGLVATHKQALINKKTRTDTIAPLVEYLREINENTILVPFQLHWLNFALNEEFCFYSLPHERYEPYALKAEKSNNMAIIGHHYGIDSFVESTKGNARNGIVTDNFEPPSIGWKEISSDFFDLNKSVADCPYGIQSIFNNTLDTKWFGISSQPKEMVLTFTEPQTISGVRFYAKSGRLPAAFRIEGICPGETQWRTLMSDKPVTGYFWSGPRPWWHGDCYRTEFRFEPLEVTNLKIFTLSNNKQPHYWVTEHIQFFTPAPDPPSELSSVSELKKTLNELNISELYCDRWVGNAVTDDDISVIREGSVYVSADTAILVRTEELESCKNILSLRGLEFLEQEVGPWTILHKGSLRHKFLHGIDPFIYWTGFNCFKYEDKQWVANLMRLAEGISNQSERFIEYQKILELAYATLPEYIPLKRMIADAYRKASYNQKAEQLEIEANMAEIPPVPAPIKFNEGIVFVGAGISTTNVAPGDSFVMEYFWQVTSPLKRATLPAVFVHFINNPHRFQDDHQLLEFNLADFQPYPEVFIEKRLIQVPEHMPTGTYTLNLGLFRIGKRNSRLKSESQFKTKRRSVELPISISVTAKN